MSRYSVPSSPTKNILTFDFFRGVDFLNTPSNVDITRAADAKNFIRGDEIGKIRKRRGYELIHDFGDGAAVNGVYSFCGEQYFHVGTGLYKRQDDGTYIQIENISLSADTRSSGVNISDMLFIIDGQNFIYAKKDDTGVVTFHDIAEGAYIPTVVIGRGASNPLKNYNFYAGTPYEPFNLLSDRIIDSFYVAEGDIYDNGSSETLYLQMSMLPDPDAAVGVTLEYLLDGKWRNVVKEWYNVGTTGRLTIQNSSMKTVPHADDDGATDNWRITYTRAKDDDEEAASHSELIRRNSIIIPFGVSGSPDRLFVAGDPENPHIDRYSEFNNPLFFPDTYFCEVGGRESPITGYSVVGTYLAIHKNNSPDGRNIYLRDGVLADDGTAIFRTVNSLHGYGALSCHGNAFLENENLFLTSNGVYAVTAAELTGERYSQGRSLYIDKMLTAEKNLYDAYAHSFGGFYYLCVNGNVYVLDSLQRSYDEKTPYSSFQYECYFLDNIPARVMFDDEKSLFFGSSDGKIYKFYDDVYAPESYNDNGKAIEAYWTTPEITGGSFFMSKTFRYISLKLAASQQTGAVVHSQVRGLWSKLFDTGARARFFDWNYIDFAKFSFSSDKTARTIGGKIKLKKVDKIALKIENSEYNEPCGIYSLGLVYTQNNYYKG